MQKFALSTSRARFAYTLSTPMYTPPPPTVPLRHSLLVTPNSEGLCCAPFLASSFCLQIVD